MTAKSGISIAGLVTGLVVGLVGSLLLHGLFIWLVPEQLRIIKSPKSQDVVHLRVNQVPAVAVQPTRNQTGRRPARQPSESVPVAPPPVQKRLPETKATTRNAYEAMLPGNSDLRTFTEAAADPNSRPRGPAATPEQQAAALELSDIFDVPLQYRQDHFGSKAMAKLVLSEDSRAGWQFEYVAGDPLLRAVLFESLRDSRNRDRILDLLRLIVKQEILVILRIELVNADLPTRVEPDSVILEGRTLHVVRRIFKMASGYHPEQSPAKTEGIPIEDEDSRKAKRRDQGRIAKFLTSPAYQSPLQQRDPLRG